MSKDIFDFVVGLFLDATRSTIKEHNKKYDTNINEEKFVMDLYKNVYKQGNAEMEDSKRERDDD